MLVPSANTRASTNMRITASQPAIEKPASRRTGCAGIDTALPIVPMTMLSSCSASSDQAIVPQALGVGRDERVAGADRFHHREQPLEDAVVHRNRDEAEHGDRAQAHHQAVGIRRRRQLERRHNPLLVRHGDEQPDDRGCHHPVQDDEAADDGVGDWERGGRWDGFGHDRYLIY